MTTKPVLEAARLTRHVADLVGDLSDPARLERRIHNAAVDRKKAERNLRRHLKHQGCAELAMGGQACPGGQCCRPGTCPVRL